MSIEILGDAEKDTSNGSRRVRFRCSCGYEGTTRAVRAKTQKYCSTCSRSKSRIATNDYFIEAGVAILDVSTHKFPGATCLVDIESLPVVLDGGGRWFAADFGTGIPYAVRSSRGEKMHRHLLGLARGQIADHRNGNGLDNRLENLVACDQSLNMKNRVMDRRNTTGAVGVVPALTPGKWVAQGASGGRRYHLGTYDIFDDAVKARKKFELEHGFTARHGTQRAGDSQ